MERAITEAEKIDVLKKGNLVAVDQAIITTFNKMTDPDSVVRESEYARTASDLALWNRLKGKIEKWQKGGAGLTISDRRALAKLARQFYEVAENKYRDSFEEYQGYIKEYKLDPEKYLKTPKWMKKSEPRKREAEGIAEPEADFEMLPDGTVRRLR
jgi:hypothetical protein